MQTTSERKPAVARASLFGRLGLRSKLILLFIAVAGIAVLAVAFVINRISGNGLTAEVGTNLNSLANSQATTIGDLLSHEVNTAKVFSLNYIVRDALSHNNSTYTGDQTAIQASLDQLDQLWQVSGNSDPLILSVLNNDAATELREYSNSFPDNVEILATDKYGATVAATSRPATFNQAKQDWWQKAYNNGAGDNFIGQPEYDANRAAYSISIAVPVYVPNTREVVGVLHSTYRTGALAAALLSVQFGQNADAYILLPNGQVLQGKGNYEPADGALLSYHSGPSARTYDQVNVSGVNRLISEAVISSSDPLNGRIVNNLGWSLLVMRDAAQALQPVNTASQTTLLTSLAVLLLTILFGVLAAQLFSSPITKLTAVANQVRAGNLNSQADIESQDEIGTLAQTFNLMTSQLSDQINTLEQRVAERSRELEQRANQLRTAAEVGSTVAAQRDLPQLLSQMTRLISERFGFYHVGIFLLDERREYAILRASNSPGGKRMLERGHQLKVGEIGIVGYATGSGEARIALDVGKDAVFFDNPDLPETRSEMALPLKAGGKILGALDIQSTAEAAFTPEDVATLQILADQMAVAIENAELFAENQAALEAAKRAYGEIATQAWRQRLETDSHLGFRSIERGGTIQIKEDAWSPEANQALAEGKPILAEDSSTLCVPILVRGQAIGIMRLVKPSDNRWSEGEAQTIQAISDQLSNALESARLYDEAQRRAERERVISDITSKISSSINIRNVLQTAVEELGRALPGSEVIVQFQRKSDIGEQG